MRLSRRQYLLCLTVLSFSLFLLGGLFSQRSLVGAAGGGSAVYLPLIINQESPPPTPGPPPTNPHERVNYYRSLAGLPPVTFDATLNDNCFHHARYMAENNHLTHNQDPNLPYASPAGQICAEKGNAWLGTGTAWPSYRPVDSWMDSIGHRLWLLYPTTPTFGYGFYPSPNVSRTGAALDVLSTANFGADISYTGWPVRYPVPNQSGIPATAYPITINWRYFGAVPTISTTSLTVLGGTAVPHTADTDLPVNHKGIRIIPNDPLPNNTVFEVNVTGGYDGQPFNHTWRFATGSAVVP